MSLRAQGGTGIRPCRSKTDSPLRRDHRGVERKTERTRATLAIDQNVQRNRGPHPALSPRSQPPKKKDAKGATGKSDSKKNLKDFLAKSKGGASAKKKVTSFLELNLSETVQMMNGLAM